MLLGQILIFFLEREHALLAYLMPLNDMGREYNEYIEIIEI